MRLGPAVRSGASGIAAALVADLAGPVDLGWDRASGAADVLSGRNIDVSNDVAQMVARAAEIEEHDLYVLRERE